MASKFESQDNIPPMDKVTQQSGTISGVARTVTGILDSITGFLAGAGVSGDGAGSSAASAVDGIVGEGDSGYTTGKATSRAASSDLRDMRSGTSPDQPSGQKYSTQISPQGRISGGYNIKGETKGLDIYPPDLGKYYMRLDFMDYERPAPFTAATVLTEYSVALPVPAGLVEYYDNKWDTPDLGVIGDIADAFTRNDGSGYSATAGATGQAAVMRVIGSVSDAAGVAISQGLGAIPNPNVTAAFRGPNLRQFSFSWTFAPKTPDESRKIQAIVRGIKKRILPIMNSGTTALLGYPSMIQPSLFLGKNEGENALFKFKKCVMPRMNVSYSPTGIPTFFKDTNLPTFVQLAITLVEIEYWTDDDPGQVVGSENKLGGASDQIQTAGGVSANTGG